MKIALVGPGLMPIPPQGWGAIESLIWKYSQMLSERGHIVTIFNSQDLRRVVSDINNQEFDFIHVHYDEFAHYFITHCQKPFCITSHYGYILKEESWSRGYFSIFNDFLQVPGIIALSPHIKQLYIDAGYRGYSYVLKNGVDQSAFSFKEKGNGKVICLGKIEPRKQQALLAQLLEGKMEIDFVGPIVDSSFSTGVTSHYKGVWSSVDVREKLTDYSTLVLLSSGEAAPLVVIEALMAGVSVVISRSSAANLEQKEFITVLEDNENNPETIIEALHASIEKNDTLRDSIKYYAKANFDMPVVLDEYESIIENFNARKFLRSKDLTSARIPSIRYYFSRVWLLLSKSGLLRRVKRAL